MNNTLNISELKETLAKLTSSLDDVKKRIEDIESNAKGESNIPKNLIEKIDSIMNDFNFNKVHSVMNFLGWTWYFDKSSCRVPSLDEIKKMAKNLLFRAVKEKTCISTGGFKVTYEEDDIDECPFLMLEFTIEECEGFTEAES